MLPVSVAAIILYGLIKRVPVFEVFLRGAKKGLSQTASLLPALTALCLMVSMLSASGALELICRLLSPAARLLGIPEEVIPLCIISPLSGSGSLAVLKNIFTRFSPDSYVGRTASVITAASETTFYAVAVYFGSADIKNTRHTVPASLIADIVSFIAAAIFCH